MGHLPIGPGLSCGLLVGTYACFGFVVGAGLVYIGWGKAHVWAVVIVVVCAMRVLSMLGDSRSRRLVKNLD